MACRNLAKAKEAADDIKKSCESCSNTGELVVTCLDLSSFKSVREWSKLILETEPRIDLLINNAGVMCPPETRTEDGNELQFQTNHLSHFLLTLLLFERIKESGDARVVNVSSVAHDVPINFDDLNYEKKYSALGAYKQSKLCNILFTKELARKIVENGIKGIKTYCLHPGVIASDLGRSFDETYFQGATWMFSGLFRIFLKSTEQGARTTIFCALSDKIANESGLYYAECKPKQPSKHARKAGEAEKLWEVSLKMVGLEGKDPLKVE